MAANANADDDYLPLNGGEPDGDGGRRNDYHLLPQVPPLNPNDAPEPNHFDDDVSLLALATCLNFGLASAQDESTPFVVISMMQQIAVVLIVFSNVLFARTCPRLAYFLDRFGVVLVFGSLFYACSSLMGLLVSGTASCILTGLFGALWGYFYFFN